MSSPTISERQSRYIIILSERVLVKLIYWVTSNKRGSKTDPGSKYKTSSEVIRRV